MSFSRDINGKILELGAKFNSVALCSLSFGKAGLKANSRALLIAAEKKNYRAAKFMLNRAANDFMGPYDFSLGAEWNKIEALAKTDKKFGALMSAYEEQADKTLDEIMPKGTPLAPKTP